MTMTAEQQAQQVFDERQQRRLWKQSAPFYRTFMRLPRDILLAIAGRDIQPRRWDRCVCGWIFRESLARELGRPASEVNLDTVASSYPPSECAHRYGGTYDEWLNVYAGVMDRRRPAVEIGFIRALNARVRTR